jgi:5-methylthioribose kinase
MTVTSLPADVAASLIQLGLVGEGEQPTAERLTGGVSSDIWKVTAGARVFCVKRAMAKLAVKDDWQVPVERNRYERQWYQVANQRVPGIAPGVIAHDDGAGLFIMDYLDPAAHRLWKVELAAGRVDLGFAAAVGERLVAIHGATAGDRSVAEAFATGMLFEALRLEPYLRTTGRRHGEVNQRLSQLADRTGTVHKSLVHGDVSPKNILTGESGPIFLDAECAWYGDPAFDLAFCLNHLLLKCLWVPEVRAELLIAFDELRDAYFNGVDWEPLAVFEARAAALLPALFLARVDGKSPVEYITDEADKSRVRRIALPLIETPPPTLAAVRDAWAAEMGL